MEFTVNCLLMFDGISRPGNKMLNSPTYSNVGEQLTNSVNYSSHDDSKQTHT
jgi:hypothetical protein